MDVMSLRRGMLGAMAGMPATIEAGTYTPDTDAIASQTHIPHGLGVVPDFVVVMADTFTATADMTLTYIANSSCVKANIVAGNKNSDGYCAYQNNNPGTLNQRSLYETIALTKFLHESTFEIPYYSSGDRLKAGITYHYVVGKFT